MEMRDELYMSRALQLASYGAGHVSPNPMVGAVLVSNDGRIIGEGFHRKYGKAHAEVNAMQSVMESDRQLIPDSTMYVTLEPCSHYGKTPPCAEMLCREGVKRVVIGTGDPNPKVAGRGVRMLRESGIHVTEGCLEAECRAINVRFFTAHEKKRPWILLKWAETATGQTASEDNKSIPISTPLTRVLMHAERSQCDAIMVGTNTVLNDNPSLTTRLWPGKSPRPVIFRSHHLEKLRHELNIFSQNPIILGQDRSLEENMKILFNEYGITSLMVEGGRKLLDSFLKANLYDRIRIEKEAKLSF